MERSFELFPVFFVVYEEDRKNEQNEDNSLSVTHNTRHMRLARVAGLNVWIGEFTETQIGVICRLWF